MPGYNKVTLVGNLTRDPETRQLANSSVTDFGLAVTRHFRSGGGDEREEVCFVDCAAFAKQGEVIAQYCRKGKLLLVEGRLRYDSWDDKAGNGKRSKLSVVVENFQFLSPPNAEPQPTGQAVMFAAPKKKKGDSDIAPAVKEAEIPF